MYKGLLTYSVIPVVLFVAFFASLNSTTDLNMNKYSIECLDLSYNISSEIPQEAVKEQSDFNSPNLGKSFIGFKEALAFKESRGNYFVVNTLGYLGKYQFGRGTLNVIGIYNTKEFLANPKLQENAFIANTQRNKWVLRRDIKRFVGKRIDGVLITESGILAAAHLGGPGNVKKYLRSYGAVGFADANGTTIRNYMNKFSGYDTSFIVANKRAKASLL